MAKQADGAVVVRLGDTVVLATACAQKEPRVGVDFLPLTVDYRENTYAGGKIPGGFFKREGRPNEKEILTSRMIDRPLRPLFPEGYACETQVVGLLLSADMENDSDTLAITGASTALYHLRHPLPQPGGGGARGLLGRTVRGEPLHPDLRAKSKLNLLVAGTEDAIVMVESGRAGDLRGRDGPRPDRGPRGHQADLRRAEAAAAARGQAQARGRRRRRSTPASRPRWRPTLAGPLARGHAQDQQARDVRAHEAGAATSTWPPWARTRPTRRPPCPRSTTACARSSCAARSW